MPTPTVSVEGQLLTRVRLTQARTSVGRRPCNGIVLEHQSVSGEHAVLQLDAPMQFLQA